MASPAPAFSGRRIVTTTDGTRFERRGVVSILLTGVAGGSIAALQPLLLGGLMAAGRIDGPQIGQAAMAESLGMALSATLAAAFLKPRNLRVIIAAAAAVALGANLLTMVSEGMGVIAARALHGACSGLMLWLLVGLLTRTQLPARLLAIYITVQACVAFALAGLFTAIMIPRFGATGSYAVLSAIDGLVLILSTQLPRRYDAIPHAPTGGRPSARGLIGLLGIVMYFAGLLGFWVYVEPLLVALGYSPKTARTAISLAVGTQIVAGIAASVLAARLRATPTILIGAAASILCILLLIVTQGTLVMFSAVIAFSFFWMFVPAFQMPFLIEIDPSRRAAMHIAAAQLFGAAIGPLVASAAVSLVGIEAVAGSAMALFAAGALCIATAHRGVRQVLPA